MGARGPAPTATAVLKARGSYRADRHGPPKAAPPGRRRRPRWRDLSERQLRALVATLPGYDPFRLAAGFTFDCGRANRALAFFRNDLSHIEGAVAGKPFTLERWQQALVANLFGWVRYSPKWKRWVRRYRECLLYVPRKNGKTPLVAGIGLYVLLQDDEPGQQNYLAACTREQAGKLFRYAKGMVQQSDALKARCRVYGGTAQAGQAKSIVKLPEETSFLQVIAADADAQHGGTGHLLLIDELHTQPDRGLVDTLSTSMASENRAEPLMVMVTTADFDRPSVCNEKHDYARKVCEGLIDDPHFLPVLYEADRDADWTDEKVWAAANPNLGVSVSLDYLRRECKKAQDVPAYQNTFRRLHLNQQTTTDSRWLPLEAWDGCAGGADAGGLEGGACFAGLDLASTTDLAALCLLFPLAGGRYAALPYFWAPQDSARRREQEGRTRIREWAEQGWIKLTPGNVIDYDVIRRDINELAEKYRVRKLGIDRWNATQLAVQLQGDGLPVSFVGMGFGSMSDPTKALEALVLDRKLCHFGHPVLRWNAGNVTVEEDSAGNLKPTKAKSAEKIDGVVAMLLALFHAIKEPSGESAYETEELTVL